MFILTNRSKLVLGGTTILLVLLALGMYSKFGRPGPDVNSPSIPSSENTYGEYLSWNEVSSLFPKFAKARIIDYETGQQFNVQRRAGSAHADVQPLTAGDTKIMKSIYGKWSWKRRAVIVVLKDGRKIAASMNGMPHGAGAIPNNNFNGHFCIHFKDSRTHASRQQDMAHQVMIWKAAGQFDQQLQPLPPTDIIKIFFTILDQGDCQLAERLLNTAGTGSSLDACKNIQYIRVNRINTAGPKSFNVEVQVSFQGSAQAANMKIRLDMVPGPPFWRIQPDSIKQLWLTAP